MFVFSCGMHFLCFLPFFVKWSLQKFKCQSFKELLVITYSILYLHFNFILLFLIWCMRMIILRVFIFLLLLLILSVLIVYLLTCKIWGIFLVSNLIKRQLEKLFGFPGVSGTDFIFLGSKITVDHDCSHEIKRHLLLEEKLWQT